MDETDTDSLLETREVYSEEDIYQWSVPELLAAQDQNGGQDLESVFWREEEFYSEEVIDETPPSAAPNANDCQGLDRGIVQESLVQVHKVSSEEDMEVSPSSVTQDENDGQGLGTVPESLIQAHDSSGEEVIEVIPTPSTQDKNGSQDLETGVPSVLLLQAPSVRVCKKNGKKIIFVLPPPTACNESDGQDLETGILTESLFQVHEVSGEEVIEVISSPVSIAQDEKSGQCLGAESLTQIHEVSGEENLEVSPPPVCTTQDENDGQGLGAIPETLSQTCDLSSEKIMEVIPPPSTHDKNDGQGLETGIESVNYTRSQPVKRKCEDQNGTHAKRRKYLRNNRLHESFQKFIEEVKEKQIGNFETEKSLKSEAAALQCISNIVKIMAISKLSEKFKYTSENIAKSMGNSESESTEKPEDITDPNTEEPEDITDINTKESEDITDINTEESKDITNPNTEESENITDPNTEESENKIESDTKEPENITKIPSLSSDIIKCLSTACFERLKQVLKNGNHNLMKSNRVTFTAYDFRTGCKHYNFEQHYDNSIGSHMVDMLKKESAKVKEKAKCK